MTLSIKDRAEMKYMGYRYRAFFTNPFGVPFHKDFTTAEEMDKFIEKAKEAGTKFNGFVGR